MRIFLFCCLWLTTVARGFTTFSHQTLQVQTSNYICFFFLIIRFCSFLICTRLFTVANRRGVYILLLKTNTYLHNIIRVHNRLKSLVNWLQTLIPDFRGPVYFVYSPKCVRVFFFILVSIHVPQYLSSSSGQVVKSNGKKNGF